MKVFITGGTGFVGQNVALRLIKEGFEVTVLTRGRKMADKGPGLDLPYQGQISYLIGNPAEAGPWQEAISQHQVIINLAGSSIFGRWTEKYKQEIRDSRINITRNLVAAMTCASSGAQTLLNASAIGYYGFSGEEEVTEESPPGSDFLASVCQAWEKEALAAERKGCRVVLMRFGLVLGKNGGVLDKLVPVFRKYLGGPLGSGEQWFSWIHVDDLIEAIIFLISKPDLRGPINICSPYPVRQKEFARSLGHALKRPSFFRTPGFILRLILGEMATVLVNGQKVYPARLLNAGFNFQYPRIDEALNQIIKS
jgi:uncharacterized protein (TIGR01777 family)